jgi:hypothetical protein
VEPAADAVEPELLIEPELPIEPAPVLDVEVAADPEDPVVPLELRPPALAEELLFELLDPLLPLEPATLEQPAAMKKAKRSGGSDRIGNI